MLPSDEAPNDVEADESTRLMPGAFPHTQTSTNLLPTTNSGEKKGFVIGDYVQNEKYAQEILDDAASDHSVFTRIKSKLKNVAIDTGVMGISIGLTRLLSNTMLDREGNSDSNVNMIQMGTIQTIATGLGGSLKNILGALVSSPQGDELALLTMKKAVGRASQEIKPLLESLPPKAKSGMLSHIEELESKVQKANSGNPYNSPLRGLKKIYVKCFVDLPSLPLCSSNTYQHDVHGDQDLAEKIDEKQREIVQTYHPDIQDNLNIVMNTHRFFSVKPGANLPFHIFEGPPGVGKTHAVRKICEALDATLITATEDDLADFFNTPRRGQYQPPAAVFDNDQMEYQKPEGKIWQELKRKAKNSNVVVFADEISFRGNERLKEGFKRVITGEELIFPNSREVAVCPKFTLIAASNENIYEQLDDQAMKDRVLTRTKFPHWTPELYATRSQEYFNDLREKSIGTFKDSTVTETCNDMQSLLEQAVGIVRCYPVGTFYLRDMHKFIETTFTRLQTANDTGVGYYLQKQKENTEKHFAGLLRERRVPVVSQPKGKVLGGGDAVPDSPAAFFLERRKQLVNIEPRSEDQVLYDAFSSLGPTASGKYFDQKKPATLIAMPGRSSVIAQPSLQELREEEFRLGEKNGRNRELREIWEKLFLFDPEIQLSILQNLEGNSTNDELKRIPKELRALREQVLIRELSHPNDLINPENSVGSYQLIQEKKRWSIDQSHPSFTACSERLPLRDLSQDKGKDVKSERGLGSPSR